MVFSSNRKIRMRKFIIVLFVSSFALVDALAHDPGQHASKSGMFGLKPEYVHVLINPLPVYGLSIGVALLAAGLLMRNHSVRTAGLVVTALCAASAWPVLYFGQHGYNSLAPML